MRSGVPVACRARSIAKARSGISDGFSQRPLSLCYNFKAIPIQLFSNITLRRQACHKPFGDPAARSSRLRFCFVPRHFAIYCEIPLHYAKLRLRFISPLCGEILSAQDDTRGDGHPLSLQMHSLFTQKGLSLSRQPHFVVSFPIILRSDPNARYLLPGISVRTGTELPAVQ